MKQVRCISPHGGCHNGMKDDGNPVFPVWDADKGEHVVPEIPADRLLLPPNPGGYVRDVRIAGGHAAVGQTYDVPDTFYADGFHWEDVEAPPPVKPDTPQTPPPATPEGD